MKPRPRASITSSGRARAEGEEMTVPGPPWTPEEDGLLRSMGAAGESATRRRGNRNCFRAREDVAMTGKDAPPEVKVRSYRDSPICDVVVVVHGTEMVLRCRDYSQAMRWARLERKSYKIPEPDIEVAAKAESRELPLFLRSDKN